MSAWELPTTVEVAGQKFAIRSDFRAVLDALAALADPELTQQEQYMACLQILYPRWRDLPDLNDALQAAFIFINNGKDEESRSPLPRLVDWGQDAPIIAPAVDKVLGGVSGCFLRYWRWAVCAGVNIRSKQAKGKKLEKSELEFARENARLIKIRDPESAEDRAEKERLLEMLGS